MQIISDERNESTKEKCAHCGKVAEGRRTEIVGHCYESRGFCFLCFECFGPRIRWRPKGRHSKIYTTPVRRK